MVWMPNNIYTKKVCLPFVICILNKKTKWNSLQIFQKQKYFEKKQKEKTKKSYLEKVIYLQGCKIYDNTPYVGKTKTKFHLQFNDNKSKQASFWKGKQNIPQKRFHLHYVQDCHKSIDDWEVTLFEKCETHKQLKERETFWQHNLKTFYPLALSGKEEYLF